VTKVPAVEHRDLEGVGVVEQRPHSVSAPQAAVGGLDHTDQSAVTHRLLTAEAVLDQLVATARPAAEVRPRVEEVGDDLEAAHPVDDHVTLDDRRAPEAVGPQHVTALEVARDRGQVVLAEEADDVVHGRTAGKQQLPEVRPHRQPVRSAGDRQIRSGRHAQNQPLVVHAALRPQVVVGAEQHRSIPRPGGRQETNPSPRARDPVQVASHPGVAIPGVVEHRARKRGGGRPHDDSHSHHRDPSRQPRAHPPIVALLIGLGWSRACPVRSRHG
jgi:hypothetical protein